MGEASVIESIWLAELDSANIKDGPAANAAYEVFNEFVTKHGIGKNIDGQNVVGLAMDWGTAREYQGFERGFKMGMRLARECFEEVSV